VTNISRTYSDYAEVPLRIEHVWQSRYHVNSLRGPRCSSEVYCGSIIAGICSEMSENRTIANSSPCCLGFGHRFQCKKRMPEGLLVRLKVAVVYYLPVSRVVSFCFTIPHYTRTLVLLFHNVVSAEGFLALR
jgi:hypothetical protein